jgi:cardiolipin synthase A/B
MLRRSLLATAISMGTAVAAVAAVGLAASPASAVATYTLQTFPDQGFSSVYSLINGAQKSINMTMYELADTTAEDDLAAAAARGVDVRVILDQAEKSTNAAAFKFLNARQPDQQVLPDHPRLRRGRHRRGRHRGHHDGVQR